MRRSIVVAIAAVGFCYGTPVNAQRDMNSWIHVTGRYPSLAENREFFEWTRTNDGNIWHEQYGENRGKVTVILQSRDGFQVFAAEIDREQNDEQLEPKGKVLRTAALNVAKLKMTRGSAIEAIAARDDVNAENIQAIRPVVTFSGNDAKLRWEIETISKDKDMKKIFSFSKDEGIKVEKEEKLKKSYEKQVPPADDQIPPAADSLAGNELHHLSQFQADTQTAIGSATTVEAKARGIYNYVRNNYIYDGNIVCIDSFTWSDLLARDQNGRKGICDEWAVVQVTMLRQAGIPARIKFLHWEKNGEGAAHACVEYQDGNLWFHMDALWNAFQNPARYRNSGVTNVTVMDADYPFDSRSTADAWGKTDTTGDDKLHPYKDFTIIPSYPGESRSGYSN